MCNKGCPKHKENSAHIRDAPKNRSSAPTKAIEQTRILKKQECINYCSLPEHDELTYSQQALLMS